MDVLHQYLYRYVMETQYKTLKYDEEYRKAKCECTQAEAALTAALTLDQQKLLEDFIDKYNVQAGYESQWAFMEGLSLPGALLGTRPPRTGPRCCCP
ncbi:MAG: hypothetical protein HFF76_09865 [Oscillospiraceae bacterium]|nr:hypothetical protein [Oscillospiraceae bacterium]